MSHSSSVEAVLVTESDEPRVVSWLASIHLPVLVGATLRFGFAAIAPLAPQWDGVIYVRGAELLAAGRPFSQRILDASGPETPTAFYPVGLSAVLGVVRRLGGGLRADLALQALAGTLSLALLAWIARRLVGRRLALRATWLHALAPGAVMLSGTWLAEPLVTLGTLLGVAVAMRLVVRRPVAAAIGFGLIVGATALLRPTPLVIAAFVSVGLAVVRFRGLAKRAAFVTLVLVSSMAALAPWSIRNARALGAPVLVSTNGGVNLLIGTYGDGSYRDMARPPECGAESSEVELDRCRSRVATRRIARNPLAWIARGVSKLWHTFGHESSPAQHLAIARRSAPSAALVDASILLGLGRAHWAALIGLATFGALARLYRPFGRGHAILLGSVIGLALLHFVYIGGDRYHAPVAPFLAILAAEATAYLGVKRVAPGARRGAMRS